MMSSSNNSVKVSVILPFYNAAKTLERAITSIRKQTLSDFECLLVDNNSTDESPQIAADITKQDSRFVLIKEKRQGVVFAHNRGLELSKGKYIARMDADDWSYPIRLEEQATFLDKNQQVDVVCGRADYIPHKQETAGFDRYVNWSNSVLSYEEIIKNQFVESPIINPTVMWRKEISNQFESYRWGAFPEDYELWLRWLQGGVRIEKLPVPLIKWYDSDGRLTRSNAQYSDEAFFGIKSKYLAKWLKDRNPFYPDVWVWGASKISRRHLHFLEDQGINIKGFIDISTKRKLDKPVIHHEGIPSPDEIFVLVYLKEEKMKEETSQFLKSRRFKEAVHFLHIS